MPQSSAVGFLRRGICPDISKEGENDGRKRVAVGIRRFRGECRGIFKANKGKKGVEHLNEGILGGLKKGN